MGVLGRRVGGPRLGLAAAGVCAVYPLMIVVDGALMSETASTPLVILTCSPPGRRSSIRA